jgi:hypothetical protein
MLTESVISRIWPLYKLPLTACPMFNYAEIKAKLDDIKSLILRLADL